MLGRAKVAGFSSSPTAAAHCPHRILEARLGKRPQVSPSVPGGSIGVVALLARNTTLVEAHGLQDPNNPGSELPRQEADLAGHRALGWIWQNDPLFKVRYRY